MSTAVTLSCATWEGKRWHGGSGGKVHNFTVCSIRYVLYDGVQLLYIFCAHRLGTLLIIRRCIVFSAYSLHMLRFTDTRSTTPRAMIRTNFKSSLFTEDRQCPKSQVPSSQLPTYHSIQPLSESQRSDARGTLKC